MCFAAQEVQGTPPKKLNSDFGAKMGGGPTQKGSIWRNARGEQGGGGLQPQAWERSLQESCSGDFQLAGTLNGDLHWRFALEIFIGDFHLS